MTGFNERVRGGVPTSPKCVLASVMSLLGVFLISQHAQAMRFDQMKALAGTALLDLRVDAVLSDCGLPSVIADAAEGSPQRQTLRWGEVEMKLSPMKWELVYSRRRGAAHPGNGWINPASASAACLSDLSGLALHARGDAGFLTVRKRADNQGYLTSYQVPEDLYVAHQVIGITGRWKQAMPVSRMQEQYGKPDEILDGEGGMKHYRYWVVVKQKEMPASVYAVDFEVKGTQKACTTYTVQTNGFEFVQEKLDALQRQWERDYVLD